MSGLAGMFMGGGGGGKDKMDRAFADQSRSRDRTEQVNNLIRYLNLRGKIYLECGEHEKAYLSYTKALSVPYNAATMGEGESGRTDMALRDSFSKSIILNKVMQMRNGASILDGSSCGQRSVLNLSHLLHFTNKLTLQQLNRFS